MKTHKPFVVIEVQGGVAEVTAQSPGVETYLVDWDNIGGGDLPPDLPPHVLAALPQASREAIEDALMPEELI